MSPKTLVAAGAILGFLTVALGAFGAHALEDRLDPEQLATWETAVLYQGLHALALIGLGLWSRLFGATARLAGAGFLIGVVLFSGSLYALVLGGPHGLVYATPIGGVAFLTAWFSWAVRAFRETGK